MSLVKVFFRTSSQNEKSSKLASHSSPRVPASVNSPTLAAQLEDAPLPDSNEWVQFSNGGKPFIWNRRTNATVWQPPPRVKVVWVATMDEEEVPTTGTGIRVSVRGLASPHPILPLRPCDHAAEVPAALLFHVLAVLKIQFTIRVPDIPVVRREGWPCGGAN